MLKVKQVIREFCASLPAPIGEPLLHAFYFSFSRTFRERRRYLPGVWDKLTPPYEVLQGPFRGTLYLKSAFCSEIAPKLLGTYELELIPAIEAICASRTDVIIDIGAAEGYYAVGFARRLPSARVICFEASSEARQLLGQLIRLNNASERISVRGVCDAPALSEALQSAKFPVVICDCEGAEDSLLDPAAIPKLRVSTILVEWHEHLAPGVANRIAERFQGTHSITRLMQRPRTFGEIPSGVGLTPNEARVAMDELRPVNIGWYVMVPLADSLSKA